MHPTQIAANLYLCEVTGFKGRLAEDKECRLALGASQSGTGDTRRTPKWKKEKEKKKSPSTAAE